MNKKRSIGIFATLGPSSLNKKFLKFANNKIDLVRINMSHVSLKQLERYIILIKNHCKVPICLDTEGAQIRTKIKGKSKLFRKGKKLKFIFKKGNFQLYPYYIFNKLKKGDILDIGFEGLKLKIVKKMSSSAIFDCLATGKLENNKGVHLINRKIKLNYITEKDKKAIVIAKKNGIKNFALSFTNDARDIEKFNDILPKTNKIFKIETKKALKNFNSLIKKGKNFLIDRGDLSKDIGINYIPLAQRKILKKTSKNKSIKISIATNFLESMIVKPFPTRAEVNDIYNALELGVDNLVLAAETAVGHYPEKCVNLLREIIKVYKKN